MRNNKESYYSYEKHIYRDRHPFVCRGGELTTERAVNIPALCLEPLTIHERLLGGTSSQEFQFLREVGSILEFSALSNPENCTE